MHQHSHCYGKNSFMNVLFEHNWPVMRKKGPQTNIQPKSLIDQRKCWRQKNVGKESIQVFYRQFPMAIETISADFLQSSFPVFSFIFFCLFIVAWHWRGENQLESDNDGNGWLLFNARKIWLHKHRIDAIALNFHRNREHDMQPLHNRKDTVKKTMKNNTHYSICKDRERKTYDV